MQTIEQRAKSYVEGCELREVCENVPYVQFAVKCNVIIRNNEYWKRKEE